jgi:hypothetical protein
MTIKVISPGRIRRSLVALVAAYALAVQAILLAFVPAVATGPAIPTGAAPIVAALCVSGAAQSGGYPSPHDAPCAAMCAALLSGVAGPLPPAVAIAAAVPVSLGTLASNDDWVPPSAVLRGPHAPRAPPVV